MDIKEKEQDIKDKEQLEKKMALAKRLEQVGVYKPIDFYENFCEKNGDRIVNIGAVVGGVLGLGTGIALGDYAVNHVRMIQDAPFLAQYAIKTVTAVVGTGVGCVGALVSGAAVGVSGFIGSCALTSLLERYYTNKFSKTLSSPST
jgi:hypothetical protein